MSPSPLEQLFWGHFPVERATAYFFYTGVNTRNILYTLKYDYRPVVGRYLSCVMADEISDSGFFNDIDVIVPVPLSRRKKWTRGYNQCEWIARGISDYTGIPMLTSVVERTKNNPSQTGLTLAERWGNVEGIFRLRNADALRDKHVLLVDDVVTTGATTISCARAMAKSCKKISVLALAMAGERRLAKPLPPVL